ncbi:helix-turn-helix domain-containing protein [Actinomadura rugatobispora]|uniref:Helix-turn-helix domain-containing protein n=1 Tax=Actinomadura rugatobispora TaxID=1994 RepID=A0ABW1ACQ3_9ACTN|nr:helix-turn-helix transcriptional regulator [Actinomadura rugatobispora]
MSTSSSAQAARQRLADQLREIREDAGLTGRKLAELAGWHGVSKVSKIEHATRPISAEDLRTWCRVCDVPPARVEELLAELRSVTSTWLTYKQLNRGGLRRAQESVRDRYERANQMRAYATKALPGLLQTEPYTRAALRAVFIEQGVEADDAERDIAEAVAERMDRQRVLRRPGARFAFVLEEEVLWHRTIDRTTHIAQLRHLLKAMRRPAVSLGIIPRQADRTINGPGVWPEESFLITNAEQVNVELVSGYLSITQPTEVAMYLAAWDRLFALAVHGERANQIIGSALESLESH